LHVAIPETFYEENTMPKKIVKATPAKETAGSRFSRVVAKGKDFGKNVAERAKAAGATVKAAGAKAASHVSRNRASYIAGGLGAAAGAAGMAAMSRKKQSQSDD
jgi:hypothetical protein